MAETEELAITELVDFEPTRLDGVKAAATGIPFLIMKSIPLPPEVVKGARSCANPKCGKSYDADHAGSTCEKCGHGLPGAPAAKSLPDWHGDAVALVKKAMVRGKVDESADIDGGQQAIALLGKLIGYEAQELAAGNLGEVADIGLLAEAAGLLRQWVSGESAVQDGNVMPATALMQSAADPWTPEQVGKFAAELAKVFPGARLMPPEEAAGDAPEGAIAKEGTDVDTVTQGTGDLSKVVEDAVTKATAPLIERITALDAELAKVKAAPVPGGPMMSVARPSQAAADVHAVTARKYEDMAASVASPSDADLYRQLAAQERAKAAPPAA